MQQQHRAGIVEAPISWAVSGGIVPYPEAVAFMETHVDRIAAGAGPELVWLLEHPPVYTAGTGAKPQDLLDPGRFPVYRAGRGGQYTYHGPGQRIVYVMLDVRRHTGGDIRAFVAGLQTWIVDALAVFGVRGETRGDRIGVWVRRSGAGSDAEDKIAAVGIRVRRWVSFHGVSINVAPNLDHFSGIVPCGLARYGVTSLAGLGQRIAMSAFDDALRSTFERRFAPTRYAAPPLADREDRCRT
ncbi:MAG: lipoyl(octanoyl) transferase LipB [Hyphomicrobiaceae bacterium]